MLDPNRVIGKIYKKPLDFKIVKLGSYLDSSSGRLRFFVDKIKENKNREFIGMKTRIQKLDMFTQGLIKKTVMSISAYTNVGKSALAYWITTNLLEQGHKGLFFSLEVSQTTVLNRILACMSGLSWLDIAKGKVTIPHIFEEAKKLPLKIYDNKATFEEIQTCVAKETPDFIVIDFIQNVDISKNKEEYQQLTSLASNIQRLAIRYGIAVLSLSQISQEGAKEKKHTRIIYSKGSNALAYSADVSIELRAEDDVMDIIIKKNKFGKRGEFQVKVDFETNQFQSL
jgi:replicative DNA helicase